MSRSTDGRVWPDINVVASNRGVEGIIAVRVSHVERALVDQALQLSDQMS